MFNVYFIKHQFILFFPTYIAFIITHLYLIALAETSKVIFFKQLRCKEIKPVNPKGNQPWIFIGRTAAEAETPIHWPPDAKNWLIGKDPDAGKDWRQKGKGTVEDEMVGWHHQLDGLEFEQAPGVVMDREAWHAAVHGVAKSWTRLSDWTESMEVPLFFCALKWECLYGFTYDD